MPNWCLNSLTISHPDMDRIDRFESAYMRGDVCETFLPEPKSRHRRRGVHFALDRKS